jgi:hypothetical protein
VSKELDTLLTALYVLIDDHVAPTRVGRGRRPVVTDSELLTVAWLRCCCASMVSVGGSDMSTVIHTGGPCSPHLPRQSGYNKRLRKAEPLLCKAIWTLAVCCPSSFDDLWITDATPVPCGMSCETAKRSDLAGHAGYGYCASHSHQTCQN